VRGAMKAAWDKLRGPTGKLGAPVGDQAVDGDVISQQFTGGKISWNRAKNAFTTDPANLAPLLSGLQVSGQNQPSTSAMPSHGKKFTWHWWWLLAAVPVLVLLVLAALLAGGWRGRRRTRRAAAHEPERGVDAGYDAAPDGHWERDDADIATEHLRFGDLHASEHEPPPDAGSARVSWSRAAGAAAGLVEDVEPGGWYGEVAPESEEGASHFEVPVGIEEEDPDAVDTDSIPVPEDGLSEAGHPELPDEAAYAEPGYAEADYTEADYEDAGYPEAGYPDVAVPHTPPNAAYLAADAPQTAEPEAAYPDVAVPHAAPDVGYPEAAAADAHVDDTVVADAVAPAAESKAGRHAAADAEAELADEAAGAAPAGRPTIHLPLEDPYQMPDGYPIKASARFGLYYTPGSELYHDTLAEIWLSSEEVAQANGFIKAD
jgi:uncharacterized protein with LGFP repeats